jgi:hypothetical protein
MSTGGAAMKATMKHTVAANRVGIIRTPNQPTYKRLLVEVTHSQKFCHGDVCCLVRVVAIVLNKKVRPSGNGGVTISPAPSAGDMKDVFIHPRGLGLRGVTNG